jgi:hypothetical protein
MKFRILTIMIASVCMAVSGLANAVPITHNDYTLDPTTNIVTHTDGTEWLQWDVTKGQSISDALDIYAGAGWALAGNAQMAALYGNFGWSVGIDDNSFFSHYSSYTSGIDDSSMDKLIELFGATDTVSGNNFGIGIDSYVTTQASYGSDNDADGLYKRAEVYSDNYYLSTDNGSGWYYRGDLAWISEDFISVGRGEDVAGVALVREVAVPEPASLAIFALGTFGLALRRFKKQS